MDRFRKGHWETCHHLPYSYFHHLNDWSCQCKAQVVCPRCAHPTWLGCSWAVAFHRRWLQIKTVLWKLFCRLLSSCGVEKCWCIVPLSLENVNLQPPVMKSVAAFGHTDMSLFSRAILVVCKFCYRLSSHKCRGFMYDFKSKHFFLGTGICPCTKNRNNFSLPFAIIFNISMLVWQSL